MHFRHFGLQIKYLPIKHQKVGKIKIKVLINKIKSTSIYSSDYLEKGGLPVQV